MPRLTHLAGILIIVIGLTIFLYSGSTKQQEEPVLQKLGQAYQVGELEGPVHGLSVAAATAAQTVRRETVVAANAQAIAIIPIAGPDAKRKLALAQNLLCSLRQNGATRVASVFLYIHPTDLVGVEVPPDLPLYSINTTVHKACASISVPLDALEKGHPVFWLEPTNVVLANPFYPPSPHELTMSTTEKEHKSLGRRRFHPGPCPERQTSLSFYSANPALSSINTLRRADFACKHHDSKQYHQAEAAMQSAIHEYWLISENRVTFGCYDHAMYRPIPSATAPDNYFTCQTCGSAVKDKLRIMPILYQSSVLSDPGQAVPSVCMNEDKEPRKPNKETSKRSEFAISCLAKGFVNLDMDFLESVSDTEFQIAFDRAMQGTAYLRGPHIDKFTHGGWRGPWVDDYFISSFSNLKASFFRPIIPLFINWQDYMQKYDKSADLWETLELVVDHRFPYITVNQHDCGNDRLTNSFPNVIAMSAGGYGHIALPLIRGERPWPKGPNKRARDIFWKGDETIGVRNRALGVLRKHFNFTPGTNNYQFDLTQHVLGYAPRGHGRTSFRLMELIQSGTIPLYMYDDVPWMPYHPKVDWGTMALWFSLAEIDKVVPKIKALLSNATATDAMEQTLKRLRKTHFTNEGMVDQMRRLFVDPPTSDLVCNPLPYWGGTDLWPPKCLAIRTWRWEEWQTPEHVNRW